MGLLGILALLQIGFIPGVLVTAQLKFLTPFDRSLLILPFSCLVNYLLVIILTVLGIYNQATLLLILALEVGVLLLYAKNKLLQEQYAIDIGVLIYRDKNQSRVLRWIAVSLLVFYAALTFKQVGTVFTDADVVVSWNTWAIDWYNGISPRNTFHYPQMLPALYSLVYQFMGTTEVELFAKLVPAIFPVMLLLTFIRMASLRKQNTSLYLLVMILFWFFFSRMMGSHSAFSGYADMPLVYFGIVAMYIFYLAQHEADFGRTGANFRFLVLCTLVVAEAAITKHSALYLAAIMPIAWYFQFGKVNTIRQLLVAYLIMLAVAGSWFIYKQTQIYLGLDSSNLQYLSEIVVLPWYAKLWHGLGMISSKISWLWIPLFIAGLLTPLGRAHAVWIFIPFFLLWSIFASYDYRNLILALPSLALIIASGMFKLHVYFTRTELSRRIYRVSALTIFYLGVVGILATLASSKIAEDLVSLQNAAKHATGEPVFNEKLYAYFEAHPEPGKIASTYYALAYLPGLKERNLNAECGNIEQLADSNSVRYLLVYTYCTQAFINRLGLKHDKRIEGQNVVFFEVRPDNLLKDPK